MLVGYEATSHEVVTGVVNWEHTCLVWQLELARVRLLTLATLPNT